MSNDTSAVHAAPTRATIETFVREKVQCLIQRVLEEEVTELLGRARSERRAAVDAPAGYRNGYGEPRRLAPRGGTITLRRPRVRGLEERFKSRVLPLFARRSAAVGKMLPELYLHGLSLGDFELALRGLLGQGAPLSASSIARLRAVWGSEHVLRTSNVVESPFAALRLRTNAAKRLKNVTNATALIWKVLRVVESHWRKLDAPELLKDVYEGRRFADGKPITRSMERSAA